MDPKMLLKAVGHHKSPSWRFAFHTADRCRSYWSPLSWLAWRIWQEMWAEGCGRGWQVPLQCQQKLRASWGASNSLKVACGKGHLLWCCLLPWGHTCCGGRGMMGSLQGRAWRRGSQVALYTGGRDPKGRRSWPTGFVGPQLTPGPLAGSQGYPP